MDGTYPLYSRGVGCDQSARTGSTLSHSLLIPGAGKAFREPFKYRDRREAGKLSITDTTSFKLNAQKRKSCAKFSGKFCRAACRDIRKFREAVCSLATRNHEQLDKSPLVLDTMYLELIAKVPKFWISFGLQRHLQWSCDHEN
jgi:hypothetical protein